MQLSQNVVQPSFIIKVHSISPIKTECLPEIVLFLEMTTISQRLDAAYSLESRCELAIQKQMCFHPIHIRTPSSDMTR